MKNRSILTILSIASVLIFSCSGNNKEASSQEQSTESIETKTEEVEIKGFNSIETLAASVIKSLQNNDYDSYYSHVMTEEMELAQADRIKDDSIKKQFLHEYGFSLHEEKEYFDNLLHYYNSRNIDLSKATLADMEYTEYKGGEYEPIMLYEVFIPIEMEYESLIDFTVIEIDGMYYLTSEIGM